jgi:hypothetical protein
MSEFDYSYAERHDRDINAGLYVPFYIETPVEDVEFDVGDEATDIIPVAIQVVDPGGDALEEKFALELYVCSDAAGETVAAATNVEVAVVTGAALVTHVAHEWFSLVTDDAGLLELTFTDTSGTGTETLYIGIKLPNGKYIVSDAITFA